RLPPGAARLHATPASARSRSHGIASSSRAVASHRNFPVNFLVQLHAVTRLLQHVASQILGQAMDVPARFDVAGEQTQERTDGGVLVLRSEEHTSELQSREN